MWSPSASRSHWEVTVCTPRRRGVPFAPAKGSKRVFKPNLRSPVGVAENMQGAKPVRLAAGAFLLCVQKEPKYAWGCAPRPRRVGTPRPESQSNGFPERDETTLIRLIFNLVSAGTHIKCAAGYLWSASVRSTDLDFSPQKNLNPYPAQLSVKGVCQGGICPP